MVHAPPARSRTLTPLAVNMHLLRECNARCRFCFATFADVPGRATVADNLRILRALWAAGAQKVNFAGGEPTLYGALDELLVGAKDLGFTTSIVTNGVRLEALLERLDQRGRADALDWVGVSCDSAREETLVETGRARPGEGVVARTRRIARVCRERGIRFKLNTVVTIQNVDEDMSALLRELQPERWKVFQALPMEGQNDGRIEELQVEDAAVEAVVERHQESLAGASAGLLPVAEDNEAMRGSYIMVDPEGRFFGNATGRHVYSRPVLVAGVWAALEEVGFDVGKFVDRGGVYDWGREAVPAGLIA